MTKQTIWGIFTPQGDFQAITNTSVTKIEYASKSTEELKELLKEKIGQEQYEQCALIRDEIARR